LAAITFCVAENWAEFLRQQKVWLKSTAKTALIIIPMHWQWEQLQDFLPDFTILNPEELLARYIKLKYGQNTLLSKQVLEQLLFSIISQKPTADQAFSSRFLNIETYYQGYALALTDFILDFRQNGEDNLLHSLNKFKGEALSAQERDLIDIHVEFENLLVKQNLFDYRRAVSDFLDEKVKGHLATIFPELSEPTLVILGFDHITPLESKFLGRLMYRNPRTILTYCKSPEAAEATFKCQHSLNIFIEKVRQVFKDNLETVTLDSPPVSVTTALSQLLFKDEKNTKVMNTNQMVLLHPANDRFQEITFIARQIRELQMAGIAYENMRIICPDYELYAALILETFPDYEIPFYLHHGTPLAFYPLAQLFSNFANHPLVLNPFPLREHIFSSPYISFSSEVAAAELIKFVDQFAPEMTEFKNYIQSALKAPAKFKLNYLATLSLQKKAHQVVRAVKNLHPFQVVIQYLKNVMAADKQKSLEALYKATIQYYLISQAERTLNVWRKQNTPATFRQGIEKLIQRFEIEQNIPKFKSGSDKIVAAMMQQDLEVLKTIRRIAENVEGQFTALSHDAEKTYELTDLARSFLALMADPKNFVATGKPDGVQVFRAMDAPVNFWPCTFLAGLIDGEFPEGAPFNFLQPRHEGEVLSSDLSFVERDRHQFYQLLSSTTQKLILSYPVSNAGKKLLTSPFIHETGKCFPENFSVESGNLNSFFTNREKLVFLGKHVDYYDEKAKNLLHQFQKNLPDYFNQIYAVFESDGLRNGINEFSRYDGLFATSAGVQAIQRQLEENSAFNAEIFERFAGCPLRFLFDNLMHIKPDYLQDYHPDTTERGIAIHRILLEYTRAAAQNGAIPKNASGIVLEAAENVFAQQLNERDDLFNHHFKTSLLAGLSIEQPDKPRRPGTLAAFLQNERVALDLLKPYLADLAFEPDSPDNCFMIQEIPLHLHIERVDSTLNDQFLIIFNYSIGDLGNVDKIGKGLQFKLPLQILALRRWLAVQNNSREVTGAGTYLVKNYRNIKRGGYFAIKDLQAPRKEAVSSDTPIFSGQRKFGFLPGANFEQELDRVQERIIKIKEQIEKGAFHLPLCAIRDQICDNCHFIRICRKEQLRLDKLYLQVDEKQVYKPLRRSVVETE
jgi:ATP-dependent helicase/DNAse subunit B